VFGNIFYFVFALLAWSLIGYLAGRLLRGRGYGVLGNLGLGLVGGILGSLVFGLLGISIGFGPLGPIITGVAGSILLIFLVRFVRNEDFAK
jgi:uncharacterized membrane protein YeaQ/YmgE (transglycosylase-associated protein family)